MVSPSRLKIRPRQPSPTGTVIGAPVSTAGMPRTSPSVELIATQRTTLSPMWSAASTVRRMPFSGTSILIALRILGSFSGSNDTSTVGPITCTTLPTFCAIWLTPGCTPGTSRRMVSLLESFRSTHDVEQLLGDHRLPQAVPAQNQQIDQLAGVLARRAHRDHA